jgi:hypothetical protein
LGKTRFAGAPQIPSNKGEMMQLPNRLLTVSFIPAEHTQPLVILLSLRETPKKWGKIGLFALDYRFLNRIKITPITMIAISAALPKPMTYVSVIDAGGGVGVGVACGASATFM